MSARFISLEGSDGSGKSTLLASIEKWFDSHGIEYVTTREPGGTELGEEIRQLLLKPGRTMSPMAELLLYEAARAEHVQTVIAPTLKQDRTVLCDRFTHSTLAYQGYARGIDLKLVDRLNDAATCRLAPDAVIWLKISPEQARKRMKNRGSKLDRLEQEKETFHQNVFEAFKKIAEDQSQHFIVLDATASPQQVFEELLRHPTWQLLFGVKTS